LLVEQSLSAERFRTWLLICFAVAALLLATLGIGPLDPGTFLAVLLILVLVALGAALFPAWRVVRTNPITALRAE
jgi:ABC-type antimicrobial peptide transport system permease subunit